MFISKAFLTITAAAALFGGSHAQNNVQAAVNNPTVPEKVYYYQGNDLNEINRIIESYFNKNISQNTVSKTAPTHSQPAQTASPKPVTQQPAAAKQPASTQTVSTLSAFEQKVVDLTNQERAKNGLPALKVDATLSKMAHEKSRDMSANGYFSHTSPTYGSPFDMMKQYGITYRYAGENIAMGQKTPEEVVNAWMNSPGHRANILNPNYNYIGVGYVSKGNYWTQDFIGK
jgi:uncharacterized YkwD family protein